jgi:hypothetical protein
LEATVVTWLKATIERLEHEDSQGPPTQEKTEVHVKARIVSAE